MKEDENTAADWAKYTIAAPYNHREYSVEVLKASAKIAQNNRAWNALNEHSGDLDVWINATAYISCADGYEFIIIGVCLSDIWQITYENAPEIASHMYI